MSTERIGEVAGKTVASAEIGYQEAALRFVDGTTLLINTCSCCGLDCEVETAAEEAA